jgi:predicted transcriptional regulator
MDNEEPKSEDMAYRAYLQAAISLGSEEIDRGETIDHDEVKRRLAKWLEK